MGMYMGSHPASATGRTRHAERVFVKSSSAGRTHAGVRPSLHCMRTGTDARALENHEDALADAQHGLQEARRVSEVPRQSAREMHHEQGYAYGPDPAELHLLDGIVVRNQLHARGVSFGPASEVRLGEHGRRPGVHRRACVRGCSPSPEGRTTRVCGICCRAGMRCSRNPAANRESLGHKKLDTGFAPRLSLKRDLW